MVTFNSINAGGVEIDPVLAAEKGQPDGVATLDVTGNVPLLQLGNAPSGGGGQQNLFIATILAGNTTTIDIAAGFTFKTGLFLMGSSQLVTNASKQIPLSILLGKWESDGFAYADIPHPNNTSFEYKQRHTTSGVGGDDRIFTLLSSLALPGDFTTVRGLPGFQGEASTDGGRLELTRVGASPSYTIQTVTVDPERVTGTTLRLNINTNSFTADAFLACLLHE